MDRFDLLAFEPDEQGQGRLSLDAAPRAAPRAGVVNDDGRIRRLKALALTGPLHELEAAKGQRGWSEHNMTELAVIAIDVVVDHQELDGGVTGEQVKTVVAEYAYAQCPQADGGAVAEVVLDALVRQRDATYGDFGEPGRPRTRRWPFALLREVDEGAGVHLRATDAAINLLIGALDVGDLESVQAATETLVAKLIERGRFDDARRAAGDARLRSIQYAERLRELVADARNSIATVDLAGQVLPALADARGHLAERVDAERLTLERLRDAAARLGPEAQAPVEALRVTVSDTLRRHGRLHLYLQHAPEEFERLQVEQGYEPGVGIELPDPETELLAPTLTLTAGDAVAVIAAFETALMPPGAPVVIDLPDWTAWLLRPRRTPTGTEPAVVEEPHFAGEPDPDRFGPEERAAVAGLVDAMDGPVTLSRLLAAVREHAGPEAARLMALRALAAFAADLRDDDLVAAVDGQLDDAEYTGDELLLARAALGDEGVAASVRRAA